MDRIGLILVGIVLLLGVTAVMAAAEPPMKAGLWEISTSVTMPGMPYQPPATTATHCYTEEEIRDYENPIPRQSGDCRVTDLQHDGNRTSWEMVCEGESSGQGHGEIRYLSPTAYEGEVNLEMEGMTMVSSYYHARRIGECP